MYKSIEKNKLHYYPFSTFFNELNLKQEAKSMFVKIEKLENFMFCESEAVEFKVIKSAKMLSEKGENISYELENISDKIHYNFIGNKFLNQYLPHLIGQKIRLTFQGYKDKDNKIGRMFLLEKWEG